MLREILCGLIVAMVAEPDGAVEARRLWQNGRYAEALEAYDELLKAPGRAVGGGPRPARPGPGRLPGQPG